MADVTPLNLSDSLIGEFSEPSCFCTFSSNFNSEDIASLAFQFTNVVDKPKFSL